MARKKKEEEKGIEGGWINTFADLMNLLLCFFVLLFSMSTVDADKYEQLVTSMTESINIFDGGGNSIGQGPFVSVGTDQIVAISQYFNEFENPSENQTADDGQNSDENNSNPAEGKDSEEQMKEKFEKEQQEEQRKATEELYGKVVDEARKKNIEDQITINMDKKYQFVQISLNGAILFDSGTASIKKSIIPLLSKVGDILKLYDNHMIKIEGHTDNVPISSGQYQDNMWLSTARATEVFEYMVKKKKMDPTTMEPTGCGEYKPIASNKTANGRARNRRVELKIYTAK
ncbi:MAG: flagellar motor protein MotB [Eubacterium sp.]|nr:flagellar motor protein MotB [Eubacterium sp.]